jgi:hypothetical protein
LDGERSKRQTWPPAHRVSVWLGEFAADLRASLGSSPIRE